MLITISVLLFCILITMVWGREGFYNLIIITVVLAIILLVIAVGIFVVMEYPDFGTMVGLILAMVVFVKFTDYVNNRNQK